MRRESLLKTHLEEHSISLSEEVLQFLDLHLDYVLEINSSVRLTAIHDKSEGERLHILDSLLVLPEVLSAPEGRMLDVGTGGGYPGIPLALAAERSVDLLDSVQKKARAIEDFLGKNYTGDLELSTLGMRAEELALTKPSHYAVVLARAVSSLPALVELASPLLALGGHLVAHKGPLEDELERALVVADLTGMHLLLRREYRLPEGNEQRVVYVFEKRSEAQVDLPRRPGRAQRKPLA